MAEGKIFKPDQDFSSVLDTELPSISQLPLPHALERLTCPRKTNPSGKRRNQHQTHTCSCRATLCPIQRMGLVERQYPRLFQETWTIEGCGTGNGGGSMGDFKEERLGCGEESGTTREFDRDVTGCYGGESICGS